MATTSRERAAKVKHQPQSTLERIVTISPTSTAPKSISSLYGLLWAIWHTALPTRFQAGIAAQSSRQPMTTEMTNARDVRCPR